MTPHKAHPIVQVAFSCLTPGNGGLVLQPRDADRLREAVLALIGSPDLEDAVIDLWTVADFLRVHHNSPEAATGILAVIQALQTAMGAAMAVGEGEHLGSSEGQARRFLGLDNRRSRNGDATVAGGGQRWWQVVAS